MSKTMTTTCDRCGEVNPADIHTCTPHAKRPVSLTEALAAARAFIAHDRESLAEGLTVNGQLIFSDDNDRAALAEYDAMLAVIDAAAPEKGGAA